MSTEPRLLYWKNTRTGEARAPNDRHASGPDWMPIYDETPPGKLARHGVKPPRWFAETMQQQSDIGLNCFAVTLLAESFARRREDYGDDSICVLGWGKDGKPVYITISSEPPPCPVHGEQGCPLTSSAGDASAPSPVRTHGRSRRADPWKS